MYDHSDSVEQKIIQWAQAHPDIRAMLITSTRATSYAVIDELSDYDVILIVQSLDPWVNDRSWLNDFGEVMVVYWDPVYPDPDFGDMRCGNVTQYVSGLKIDFTLWPVALFQKILAAPEFPAELDAGYRVLLDKDHLTNGMPAPTGKGYIPQPPTRERYQTLINDFFSDVPYVAKYLWRDEILPARWCLDFDMKYVYMIPMLEWWVEIKHGWALPTGVNGKGLKKHLPTELWAKFEQTYAGAALPDTWDALLNSITFFREVAIEVGAHLGFEYPHGMDQRVTDYVLRIQAMKPPKGVS